MQRYNHKFNRSEQDNDYQKGYRDGMQDAFDKSELDAYYAGVGYGKMKPRTSISALTLRSNAGSLKKALRIRTSTLSLIERTKPCGKDFCCFLESDVRLHARTT